MGGPELDEDGWGKNPIRVDWATNGVFVTPPGWWHSHHNDSGEDAWVLPPRCWFTYTYAYIGYTICTTSSDTCDKRICLSPKASCSQFPHLVDQFEAKTDPSNNDEFNGNSEGLG